MKIKSFIYIMLALVACSNPVDDLEIGEPFSQSEAIQGSWVLVDVKHVDNLDAGKAFTDLTEMFTQSTSTISFDGGSFSYTHGSGINLIGDGSTWNFDDADYPTYVQMDNGTNLRLGNPVRSYDQSVTLILERVCPNDDGSDKLISSYELTFNRQSAQ